MNCSPEQLKAVNAIFGKETGRALCRGEIENPLPKFFKALGDEAQRQLQDLFNQAGEKLQEAALILFDEAPPADDEEKSLEAKYFGGSKNGNTRRDSFEQGYQGRLKRLGRA